MVDIARNGGDDEPVSLNSVATRTELSRGYLDQVVALLKAARLLRGVAGRYGGYRLARAPEKITVGEIIEGAIGPVTVVDCLQEDDRCPRIGSCESRRIYSLINDRISEVLQGYTLADLLDPEWQADSAEGGQLCRLDEVDPSAGVSR